MKICRDRKNKKLMLSQANCVEKVFPYFSMENVKAINTPLPNHLKSTKEMCPKMQEGEDKQSKVPYALVVGSVIHAMVCRRPNIAHVVGVISRYMSHLGIEHWNAVKLILRYLRGTSNKCLHFAYSATILQGYVLLDLVGEIDTRWSTIGYAFTIGGAVMR